MKSALALLLGVSFLASLAGCSGSDTPGGPAAVGGSGATGGSGGTGGGGGGAVLPPGVPLTPMMGWVTGNDLKIEGAMFSYGDDTSKMGMTEDFTGSNACIKGTAAKVDLKCTPVPPATDCYGTYWGAAIGLNLNQPTDPVKMMGGDPMPYDASALKGFAFEITGAGIPAPKNFRFKVEGPDSQEFCNDSQKHALKPGVNSFSFEELITACWKPAIGAPTAATVQSKVMKIAWQVVTDDKGTVPFDFCVANVRALQ